MSRFIPVLFFLFILFGCGDKKPKGTILLLASKSHFGLFAGEVLKTEGFNHFVMDSVTPRIDRNYLAGFDIVILTQAEVSDAFAKSVADYVNDGGNLIAFRPSKALIDLFGVKDISSTIHSGYVSISDRTDIGKGLITQRLQIHGDADRYVLAGGVYIAALFAQDDTVKTSAAIVLNSHGRGQTMAFAYNLPESIVYTRQGNPANAGLEKDGIVGIRAMDLFTDGFVDTANNTINQADEQMRMLTRGIEYLSLRSKPLPRFWYFPDSLKCIVTLNNDGEDSKEAEFLKQFDDVERKGAMMTLYVKEPTLISKERIDNWMNRGFEISGHPDDTRQAANPDWYTMDSVYANLQSRLRDNFGISTMRTITNHWFVWVGNNTDGTKNFAAQAEIEEKHGIGLDCNYAHYDNGSSQGHFLGAMGLNQGNYTGTGLTMKFANIDGRILNVYQQLNNVYDQQYMEHKDQEGYFNAFKGIMDRSLHEGVYSSISVRAHNNEYFFSEIPLMKMLAYARSNNIPVWAELSWLQFLEAKDKASIQNTGWTQNKLSFEVHSAIAFKRDIACLVPYRFNSKKVRAVAVNGSSHFDVVTIKGREYARVLCKAGVVSNVEVDYFDEY